MDVVKAKDELKKTVRERLGYGQEYTDEEVSGIIDDCILDSPEFRLLSVTDKRRIGKEVFDSLRRLDILQSFIEDKSVTEDLNSTNGTFKNGVRLKPYEQKKLSKGDEIKLATKKLIFT